MDNAATEPPIMSQQAALKVLRDAPPVQTHGSDSLQVYAAHLETDGHMINDLAKKGAVRILYQPATHPKNKPIQVTNNGRPYEIREIERGIDPTVVLDRQLIEALAGHTLEEVHAQRLEAIIGRSVARDGQSPG